MDHDVFGNRDNHVFATAFAAARFDLGDTFVVHVVKGLEPEVSNRSIN